MSATSGWDTGEGSRYQRSEKSAAERREKPALRVLADKLDVRVTEVIRDFLAANFPRLTSFTIERNVREWQGWTVFFDREVGTDHSSAIDPLRAATPLLEVYFSSILEKHRFGVVKIASCGPYDDDQWLEERKRELIQALQSVLSFE